MNTNPTSSAGAAAPITADQVPGPGIFEGVLMIVAIVNFSITACIAPEISLACSAVAALAYYVARNG